MAEDQSRLDLHCSITVSFYTALVFTVPRVLLLQSVGGSSLHHRDLTFALCLCHVLWNMCASKYVQYSGMCASTCGAYRVCMYDVS